MGIKFSVHTDGMGAARTVIAKACTRAEHVLAEQMEEDTAPFVPARNNVLTNDTKVIGNLVIYLGPYARYLYYGKLMVDPETGSSWVRKGEHKVLTDRNLVFRKAVHPQAQAHWCEASKAQNLDKWLRAAEKAVKKYGTG